MISGLSLASIANLALGGSILLFPGTVLPHLFSTTPLVGSDLVSLVGHGMLCLGTAAFASGSLILTRQHAYNTLIGAHAVILAGQMFQRFINDVPVPNLPIIFTGLTLLPLVLGNQNTLPKDLVMTGLGAAFTLRSLFFMINPSAVANNLLTAGHMPVLVNSLRLSSSIVMTYGILLVATGYLYLSTAGTAPKRFKLAAAVGNAVAAVASVVLSPPSFMLAVFHGILALLLGLEVAQQ